MFEITPKAEEMMVAFFKERNEKALVRIFLNEGGWSGPSLGMALDESQEGDEVFNQNGLTFMIEKGLYEQVKPIKVDFVETPRGSGYAITSSLKPADCGGGCCG